MKTVLITGVASGIGKATKEYFLQNNYYVVGIDLSDTDNASNFLYFKSDITNEQSLNHIKEDLLLNNITFDAIINIAGIHKMASLVEDDFKMIKKVIDVNLLGTMLVNNCFHSLLKESGKIIIVSSEVAELDPMPFNGLYNVSKTALNSYAQALRQELNLINQKVITIEPGAIETPLSTNSITDTADLSSRTNLYKNQSRKFVQITKKFMGKPLKPEKIAKVIYQATYKKRPKLSYKIHRNPGLILLNLLPRRLQCFIIKAILK